MTSSLPQWPPTVFVLVPAYRAREQLGALLPELTAVVPADRVLVVDDGSKDGTDAVCAQRGVSCRMLEHNRGKGAALREGFGALLEAGAEWIVTMDADGQHAVEDLPAFPRAIHERSTHGIIIGSRRKRPGTMPLGRIVSNTVTSALVSCLTGCRIEDSQCGYRAYSARLLRSVTLRTNRFEAETEVILRACRLGFDVSFVKVHTLYFQHGSHIAHVRDTLRWVGAVAGILVSLHRWAGPDKAEKRQR